MKIFHAVGNFQKRTEAGRNLKSSHIYLPLIDRMKAEGYDVELSFVHGVSNRTSASHRSGGHRRRHAHVRLVRLKRA